MLLSRYSLSSHASSAMTVGFVATLCSQLLSQQGALAQSAQLAAKPSNSNSLSFDLVPPDQGSTPTITLDRHPREGSIAPSPLSSSPSIPDVSPRLPASNHLIPDSSPNLPTISFDFPPPTTLNANTIGQNQSEPWFPPSPHTATNPAFSADGLSSPLSLDVLFAGESNSLVARAIGCAEGTRTPDGGKTWAYKGHTDPGNGVWNLGTFSWQHGATSPEEADRKQLARLGQQAIALNQQVAATGIPWGLEEQLNALDLANQSPSAALNPGGYVERLKQAYDNGLQGAEAILWARTWSYRHPSGTRWNAPGLGNTQHSIQADQKRRMDAIAKAIAQFPGLNLAQSSATLVPPPSDLKPQELLDQFSGSPVSLIPLTPNPLPESTALPERSLFVPNMPISIEANEV